MKVEFDWVCCLLRWTWLDLLIDFLMWIIQVQPALPTCFQNRPLILVGFCILSSSQRQESSKRLFSKGICKTSNETGDFRFYPCFLDSKKSLVIVTRLPFVELFQELMAMIAPEFFVKGSICLEICAKEIDQWPRPVPGLVLNLPLLGTLFQVTLKLFTFFNFQIFVVFHFH